MNPVSDSHIYISIDLKSFYASVEAADRGLDPLTTHLVVADPSRTEKTICLAVSPSLKACGISGRARLFEVIKRVKQVNAARFQAARSLGLLQRGADGRQHFSGSSYNEELLKQDPSLELTYIIAPPRMKLYEQISTKIFSIYLRYVSAEDIHVYSIDECFIDVTGYLHIYKMTARELAMTMIREVLTETGITATAGIGTNLYLAKIAMDIVAKHAPADAQGVRIAELSERSYRELLWSHTPLTDFWRVGPGIARRVAALGCRTMGDIARLSLQNEDVLYQALGVNAELLIDHAWGFEPAQISDIKAYRPETTSLSSGQVLSEPYDVSHGRLIVREMTELLALDLVRKQLVTKKLELTLQYDRTSLTVTHTNAGHHPVYTVTSTGRRYDGKLSTDRYGRTIPYHAHGTGNIDRFTSSARRLTDTMLTVFDRIVDPDLLIRYVNVTAAGLIREDRIPEAAPQQLDLFTDYAALERQQAQEAQADEKEHRLQKATLLLQDKFGKNAVLKGMNLLEGGTTIIRNGQIGGHSAGREGGHIHDPGH